MNYQIGDRVHVKSWNDAVFTIAEIWFNAKNEFLMVGGAVVQLSDITGLAEGEKGRVL